MAEDGVAERPKEFWAAVEADYVVEQKTIAQILLTHGLGREEFDRTRRRLGWRRPRRMQPINRKLIIGRLFRLLDRMLEQLEREMTKTGEAEVTILGRLVQSMGKLIEIETATNAAATPRQTKDMHDIRRQLVARIEELKRN